MEKNILFNIVWLSKNKKTSKYIKILTPILGFIIGIQSLWLAVFSANIWISIIVAIIGSVIIVLWGLILIYLILFRKLNKKSKTKSGFEKNKHSSSSNKEIKKIIEFKKLLDDKVITEKEYIKIKEKLLRI